MQAVVAEAVRRFGGKVTLIDTTSDLPNLKRQPGLLTWGVRDTKAETERWYASPSEVPDGGQKSKLTATLWPPPTEAEARALGLQHCLRLLPHYHDTGAFFVCAMVKVEATLPGHDYALGREDEPEKQATTERNPHTSVGFTHGGQAGSAAAAAQEARDERQAAAEPAAAAAPAAAEAAAASSEPRVVTETVVDGIPTPLSPLFLGRFAPVFRRSSAVLLRCPASWRRDGENGRKMAENGRNLGEKRARNSGG